VPFESLGAVSYSLSKVTMAVSVAVCEIFSVKVLCDLENKSLEMALFDRSHTSYYSFHSSYGAISYRLRDIVTYWSKIEKFLYPIWQNAPDVDEPNSKLILRFL